MTEEEIQAHRVAAAKASARRSENVEDVLAEFSWNKGMKHDNHAGPATGLTRRPPGRRYWQATQN